MSEKSQYQINDLCERLEKVEDSIIGLKENHLTNMATDISSVKADIDWLKRFLFIVATASVGGLITGVLNLILRK